MKKTLSMETMHIINTFHIQIQELNSRISLFETSMTPSKYPDTFHTSKLESGIAIIQDHLKTDEKDAITWTSKIKEDDQASSLHDRTTQHVQEILGRERHSLHLKLTNMKEREHENTLQYIQGVLQHTFGGTPQGNLEVPINYFIDSNAHTKVGTYLLQTEYK